MNTSGYLSDGSWTSSLGDVLDEDEEHEQEEGEERVEDIGARPLASTAATRARRQDEGRHPSAVAVTAARLAPPPRSSPDRRPPRTSSTAIATPPSLLDLAAIDAAFGPKSDLYRDVLGVKPNASPEQIQRSYFQRRNELFRLLADLDAEDGGGGGGDEADNPASSRSNGSSAAAKKRGNAERKMDGVVMAMRVLGDPALRGRYDDVRADRLRGRTNISPVRPQKVVVSEYRAQETTIRGESTASTAKKKAAAAKALSAATTRKKPEDETPPSPPQPPKKKQQHQRLSDEPAVAGAVTATTTSNSTKAAPNKFYRRMVPVLNSKKAAATSKVEKKDRVAVVVTPEKPTNRKSNDDTKKVAAAPLGPALRWPSQQQRKSSSQSQLLQAKAAAAGKARGIRFDMDQRREYPAAAVAPKRDDRDVDTDDDEFDGSTADVTEEGTLLSDDPSEGTLTTAAASAALRKEEQEKGFVVRVRDELCGAIEDTAASFDQVFNVFTLQDEDIRAVRYRIDKFRQQVSHSL